MPRSDWDTAIASLKVPNGSTPPTPRELTIVEKSRLESFWRVCQLRMGRNPDRPATTAPVPAITPVGPGGSGSCAPGRKLKLSAVLDPTLDAEIVMLTPSELQTKYDDYRAKFGDYPASDVDPTADQLSALDQVIRAKGLPYADFSIFGPHGLRLLRKQTFTSWTLNVATNEWTKKELPGPASFHEWYQTWKVYRTSMLLLEAAAAERLDAYSEHIRSFVTQFSEEAWWIIARTDTRLRSEHMERIRRALAANPEFGYTTANPWSAVYAKAVRDHEFRTKELVTPATLWLAQRKSTASAVGTRRPLDVPEPEEEFSANRKRKKKAKTKYTGEDKSVRDGNTYTHNRKGVEICRNYNKGTCGSSAAQGKCLNGRSHQCNLCLGPHPATACTR